MRALLLLSAVAATSAAAPLNAQVTPAKPDSTCTNYPDGRVECRVYRGGARDSAPRERMFYRMDSAMAKRAALGLELRTTGTKRDTLGVFVEAVTPKGPAENAGIVEGDRIAAINGVDVRTSAADTEDSYTNGLGSHRLSREVQKLIPGSRATLRVYSGGRFRDVQVTAGKASEVMRLGNRFGFGMSGPGGMMEFDGPGAMRYAPEMLRMRAPEMLKMRPPEMLKMRAPEMLRMRERMEPLMKERMEPLLRERLNDLPTTIKLRSPLRIKTLAPLRGRIYKVDRGDDEAGVAGPSVISLEAGDVFTDVDVPEFEVPAFEVWDFDAPDYDDAPDFDQLMFLDSADELFQFENEIDQMPPEEIRELVAITIQDARAALKQLAGDGIA